MSRKKRDGLGKFLRNGIWYLRGTVRGTYIYETTGTSDEATAEAIRIKKEYELLHASVFGKEAVYTFDDAVVSYLEAAVRSNDTKANVRRLLNYFEGWKLKDID